MYFLIEIQEQMRPKICENLTANFNPNLPGFKKSVIDIEVCADS